MLDERIAVLCESYEHQIAQLDAIPGSGVTIAQDLIGEIGVDMSVFSTAGHRRAPVLLDPRGPCPKESGGRRKGGSAAGKGNPYIGGALGEAAVSVGRTRTFLGAKLRRLVRHMPKKKAQGAVMRTQLTIAHALLSDPEAGYRELGPGYHDERAGTARQARGHIRSLERLGYKVTLEPVDPTPENSPPKPANPSQPGSRRHKPPSAAAACPAEVLLSDQLRAVGIALARNHSARAVAAPGVRCER